MGESQKFRDRQVSEEIAVSQRLEASAASTNTHPPNSDFQYVSYSGCSSGLRTNIATCIHVNWA